MYTIHSDRSADSNDTIRYDLRRKTPARGVFRHQLQVYLDTSHRCIETPATGVFKHQPEVYLDTSQRRI